MTEYAISYAYRGEKSRQISGKTFSTVEKAKNEVKRLLSGNYYQDFVIAELQPVITVKMPEPTWAEVKKST